VKKSIASSVFYALLTLLFLAIAIPTIIIKVGDQYKMIRGLDPKDIKQDFVIQDFTFRPSLDLQGGNIATLSVDLSAVPEAERSAQLDLVKNGIYLRLLNSRSAYFEMHSAISEDGTKDEILLKYPGLISQDLLQVMVTPGDVGFWVDNTQNSDPNMTADQKAQLPYGERTQSALTNSDIQSVSVVSDSRCFFNDSTKPRNYCINVTFKPESLTKFQQALYANPTAQLPILLVIDGAPVAVQTGGQVFNKSNTGTDLLMYPVVDDNWLATSVLASVINDKPLAYSVTMNSANTLAPTLGDNTLTYLKMSLLAVVLVANVLMLVYFRKRGWFAVISTGVFLIWAIAIMKIFNLILDLPLIIGFMSAYLLFTTFVVYLLYRIRTASKANLLEEELVEVYEITKNYYRNLIIFTVLVAFVLAVLAPVFMISYFNGFGFGAIIGMVILYFPAKQILSFIFLPKNKWQF